MDLAEKCRRNWTGAVQFPETPFHSNCWTPNKDYPSAVFISRFALQNAQEVARHC